MEQHGILQNEMLKKTLKTTSNNVNDTVQAEEKIQDAVEILSNLIKNREPLLHCTVFIELKAKRLDAL